jgi:hypothetical protein
VNIPTGGVFFRGVVICPEYQVPILEMQVYEYAKAINFHSHCKETKCSDCGDLPLNANHCDGCNFLRETSKKGRVRTQKYLNLLMRPIGIFMKAFYILLLNKYALHLSNVQILSKNGSCGRMRFEWFKSKDAVKTIRDYTECLKLTSIMRFSQSELFGASHNLSIEGCNMRHMHELNAMMEMHSYFLDTSRQDTKTAHMHLKVLLVYLFRIYLIQQGWLVLDNTDGCAKQYRRGQPLSIYCH